MPCPYGRQFNINIKTAGSRPRPPPYFWQTLQKYAKELSTGVGRLVVRQMRCFFRWPVCAAGRCLFSRTATGAPSRCARQGVHRDRSVVKARTGCKYGDIIPIKFVIGLCPRISYLLLPPPDKSSLRPSVIGPSAPFLMARRATRLKHGCVDFNRCAPTYQIQVPEPSISSCSTPVGRFLLPF